MKKILKYVVSDIIRNKIILAYTVLLLVLSLSIFSLEDNTSKGLLSLLNLILIILPLVSLVFSTIYCYNSIEFIELLLSQPVRRVTIWMSLFSGLAFSLSCAFLIGAGIPVLIFEPTPTGFIMVVTGIFLSVIFVAMAMLSVASTKDKAKGIGVSVLLWLFFSLMYDGLVLFLLFQFADYPLEKFMVFLSCLNPIDLGRILILLKMDISALMGYTGAVFSGFFGSSYGIIFAFLVLICWIVLPLSISAKIFQSKDL
ncbi:MAG: ABC transporter permease [Bacteroidia bacterium]|nr:ABC transporter permease [Bacteroidia bacterium]